MHSSDWIPKWPRTTDADDRQSTSRTSSRSPLPTMPMASRRRRSKKPMSAPSLRVTLFGVVMVVALAGTGRMVGISCSPVSAGADPAKSVSAGGQAGRAEFDDDRLAACRSRCASHSGRGHWGVLRRLRQAVTAIHRGAQASQGEDGRHDHGGRAWSRRRPTQPRRWWPCRCRPRMPVRQSRFRGHGGCASTCRRSVTR